MFGFVRKAKFDEHTEKFDQYVEKLELELSNAKKRIGELEETVNWRSSLFFKAFAGTQRNDGDDNARDKGEGGDGPVDF